MSKRVLLSGYYGFDNFGDDLILQVLVRQLQAWDFAPVVLSAEPDKTRRQWQVEAISRLDPVAIHRAVQSAHAFISGGGGLFQDATGPTSPVYYGALIKYARWHGLPVAFFGQGIGPLNTRMGQFFTRHAVNQSQLVCVRDVASMHWVQANTRQSPTLVGDVVWAWQPAEGESPSPQGIGVSLRPWPDLGDAQIKQLAVVLAGLDDVRQDGVNLLDCHGGEDIIPLGKLENALKQLDISCRWFGHGNVGQGIMHSRALLAMRFHALLVGAKLGLPLIALSYDPKVVQLAQNLHLADFPLATWDAHLTPDALQAAWRPADKNIVYAQQQAALSGLGMLKSWLETGNV